MTLEVSSAFTVADQELMTRAKNYFAWQAAMSADQLGQRVLEVGCGIGNFTEQLKDRELVVSIDVDASCIERHRERFRDRPNIRSLVLDAHDQELLELRKSGIDSIACLNVLEHLEDHQLVLARLRDVLPPGGRLVLLVPAFDALYGPIDRNLGHYRRYTKRSMRELAREVGLAPRLLRYTNTVGFVGWWVNAKVLRRTEQSQGQIATFDSLVVPPMRLLESWVSPPFGQSVFAVLEKP